ncbi:YnfA family protein [sulfur-oxidizing endosymbiont of Gigantopelta aegis]|uniref:YnfA family protein n=1 Tax=sulfur-oxidizing endosymbiont of Gigantopelta aegis TaxID=2794934 RepID=UPI0018DE871D|nr:YnfA family protein [sulfur-oxidizing endosymbiont of Gigantopelta aegis]
MLILQTTLLFFLTALAEIIGCYLPYLWLRENGSIWLLIPAGLSLMLFVWLLSLHPTESGRVYAAYGGVYVTTAIMWLWWIDGVQPTRWDIIGVAVALSGMLIILLGSQESL